MNYIAIFSLHLSFLNTLQKLSQSFLVYIQLPHVRDLPLKVLYMTEKKKFFFSTLKNFFLTAVLQYFHGEKILKSEEFHNIL